MLGIILLKGTSAIILQTFCQLIRVLFKIADDIKLGEIVSILGNHQNLKQSL